MGIVRSTKAFSTLVACQKFHIKLHPRGEKEWKGGVERMEGGEIDRDFVAAEQRGEKDGKEKGGGVTGDSVGNVCKLIMLFSFINNACMFDVTRTQCHSWRFHVYCGGTVCAYTNGCG